MLAQDWRALASSAIVTPDVTCGGSSRKAWTWDSDQPRLVKVSFGRGGATAVAEHLVSRMLERLLPQEEFVSYELVEFQGEMCSCCPPIVGRDEELIMGWQVLDATAARRTAGEVRVRPRGPELLAACQEAFVRLGIKECGQVLAKFAVMNLLSFSRDIHARNLGVVREVETGAVRPAPLYDYDRAFGTFNGEFMEWVCTHPQLAALMLAGTCSWLDESWDYSWYDAHALDGFEEELERTLHACPAIPQAYPELAASMYCAQRRYVEDLVT